MNTSKTNTTTKSAKRGRPRKVETQANEKTSKTVLSFTAEQAIKLFKDSEKTFRYFDIFIGDLLENNFDLQEENDKLNQGNLILTQLTVKISKKADFYRFLFLMQTLVAITAITLYLLKSSHII